MISKGPPCHFAQAFQLAPPTYFSSYISTIWGHKKGIPLSCSGNKYDFITSITKHFRTCTTYQSKSWMSKYNMQKNPKVAVNSQFHSWGACRSVLGFESHVNSQETHAMGKGFYGIIVDKDPNFRSIAKNKLTRSLVHSFFVCKISAEFLASFTLVPKSCRHKEMNNNNNIYF